MSKKSKKQRDRRKQKQSKLVERTRTSTSSTIDDPHVRKASLVNLVRGLPWDLKSYLISHCGAPPEVTFMLVADPTERFDRTVKQWPIHPDDGVAIFVTPGATKKVAITTGVILREKQGDTDTTEGTS